MSTIDQFIKENTPEAKAITEYYAYATKQLKLARQDKLEGEISHWLSVKFAVRRLAKLIVTKRKEESPEIH